ncbi:site-specific DNA-methyltransferase [Streptococcus uberis]
MVSKMILGDSVEELKKIDDNSIDGVITSPPYDNLRSYEKESSEWNFEIFESIANELYRVMKEGSIMCWVVGDSVVNGAKTLTSYKQAIYFQSIGFNMYDVLIYQKTGSGPPHKNRYFNSFEYIFVLSKGKPKTINLLKDKPNKWAGYTTYGEVTRREVDGRLTKKGKKIINQFGIRTNVWTYKNGKGQTTKDKIAHNHPAIFPEKLVEDCLKSWTNEGDLILDPFGGSGTTAKISKNLNREYIYIEKEEKYFDIAKERLGYT